ncbi:MAG: DUF5320 domain-containing protein [Promethearchaeota archaeon]
MGYGPMTGRGLGYCAGYSTPGYTKGGFGMGLGRGYRRGFGAGYGYGRGYRHRYYWQAGVVPAVPYVPTVVPGVAPSVPVNNVEFLKAQKNALEAQIKDIQASLESLNKRINELEREE